MLLLCAVVPFVWIFCIQCLAEVSLLRIVGFLHRCVLVCGKIGVCEFPCVLVLVTKKIGGGVVLTVFGICFVCGLRKNSGEVWLGAAER